MKVCKSGAGAGSAALTAEELALINGYANRPLREDEVFAFSLLLCDNEVDRDGERFDTDTLKELSALFVGKTGIRDHEWKSGGQVARIYRTELQRDETRRTSTGEVYVCLRAWAYMLRTEANASLIADIEGGIKKEISVGCAVRERVCSICGEAEGSCAHRKGERYGGKLCHTVLRGAADAYEWSFVAVPAQRAAGVSKALGLKAFTESEDGAAYAGEYRELVRMAALGSEYENALRREVLRLCLVCDKGLYRSMERAVEHMDAAALREAEESLRHRAGEKLPLNTQLPGMGEITRFDGGEYLI